MRALLRSRALATVLLAAVLLGKLLVPGGWMPVQTGRGVAVMLCSGTGPMDGWVDAAGKVHIGKQPTGKAPARDGGAKDPCPYGALHAPALLDLAPETAPVLVADTAPVPPARLAVAVGRGLAAPPPPSTGPPHSA